MKSRILVIVFAFVAMFSAMTSAFAENDDLSGRSKTNINVDHIVRKIDQLSEEQRQINSGNEMKMMQLQGAMQQRSQTIQAGSNFLSSINDASKTIVGNLR